MKLSKIDLSKFQSALKSLEAALTPPPVNDRERDGAIQRFEYTFELAWKSAKKVLEGHGIASNSPRGVFRELAQLTWISNPEQWIEFLEYRNLTTHTYQQQTADAVFAIVPKFATEAQRLLKTLEERVNE